MKIAVCIKQVIDPLSLEIDPLSGEINQERLVYIANPADLGALELALRWRDELGGQVHVLSGGPLRSERVLRDALALGADSATRVALTAEGVGQEPAPVARALAGAIEPLGVDLVLCGTRSSDRGSGQVSPRLAELLGLSQATGVVEAALERQGAGAEWQIKASRKLERGRREEVLLPLPALLAFEPGLVELRYAALPALMAAQRANLPVVQPERGRDRAETEQELKLFATRLPRPRPRQIFVPNPDLPAAARIQAILSGGAGTSPGGGNAKKGNPVEGSPDQQAERILAFLEKQGFLGKDKAEGSA